jgi:hypothetical protein
LGIKIVLQHHGRYYLNKKSGSGRSAVALLPTVHQLNPPTNFGFTLVGTKAPTGPSSKYRNGNSQRARVVHGRTRFFADLAETFQEMEFESAVQITEAEYSINSKLHPSELIYAEVTHGSFLPQQWVMTTPRTRVAP